MITTRAGREAEAVARQGACSARRALARRSGLPATKLDLVDRDASSAHADPLFDVPAHNDFLRTVVPFLERIR